MSLSTLSEVTKGQTDKLVGSSDSLLLPSGEYRAPIIVAGEGAKVRDSDGKFYIDLEGGPGVSSVGHCHPRIVAAIREQAGKLIHSPGRYLSHLAISLSERLAKLTGGRLTHTFFANSGAEAVDGAVKICIKHAVKTGKPGFGIIALEHAFHGRLSLPLSLTGMAAKKKGFGPYASFPGIVHMPSPYCYRCPLRLSPASCGTACADAAEEAMKTRIPGEVAVMIAEPILGVGGIIVPPQEYWAKIQQMCTRHGITLINDEVFIGFGRTGKMFGHQQFAMEPKAISFAKAIAGGVPLAGFTVAEEIADAFEKGDHFTTFGVNNQIGLAAAHAVLDVLEEEDLAAGAVRKGARVMSGLRRLAEKYEAIGDVRGLGLMIGFEMVRDREKRTPAPDFAKYVYDELMKRGVLVSITGVHNCVVRITPPLVISNEEIDTALDRLEEVLRAVPH